MTERPLSDLDPKEITNPALINLEKPLTKEDIHEYYACIQRMLRKYVDLKEDYYEIISLWILGTYFHDDFNCYPYLFLHAMKASGKTRLLKLIAALSKNGEVLASMSEAVLFRTAEHSTMCIDEFESISGNENAALRELLNSAYKKGTKVKRIRKQKNPSGNENYKVDEFNVYCPIVIANIEGMENVLADRCIQLIMERSQDKRKIKLLENYENEPDVQKVRINLTKRILGDTCDTTLVSRSINIGHIVSQWNDYIIRDTSVTHTQESQPTQEQHIYYFMKKIDESGIDGRHLELFFPLFQLSTLIGDMEIELDRIIDIAKKVCREKKDEDNVESRDISFILYLFELEPTYRTKDNEWTNEFISVKDISRNFKTDESDEWITPDWIGRALRRHSFLIEKRRTRGGREVRINWAKVIDKARMFIKHTEVEKVIVNDTKQGESVL